MHFRIKFCPLGTLTHDRSVLLAFCINLVIGFARLTNFDESGQFECKIREAASGGGSLISDLEGTDGFPAATADEDAEFAAAFAVTFRRRIRSVSA